ncbi:hypothetical protein FGO68_gene3701 [Halteria grandinella]|uniref:Uncharacterized protein n=1 Tax=Halteria grandinella TaxID=5974 RepID=A0A8J8NTU4_HALGN|nr:hypothetical protein FGO68_gene3701 [Halteria grandinella]
MSSNMQREELKVHHPLPKDNRATLLKSTLSTFRKQQISSTRTNFSPDKLRNANLLDASSSDTSDDFASKFIAHAQKRDIVRAEYRGKKEKEEENAELKSIKLEHQHRPYDYEKYNALQVNQRLIHKAKLRSLSVKREHKQQFKALNLDVPALQEIGQLEFTPFLSHDSSSSSLFTDEDMYLEKLKSQVQIGLQKRKQVTEAVKRYQESIQNQCGPRNETLQNKTKVAADQLLHNVTLIPSNFLKKSFRKLGINKTLHLAFINQEETPYSKLMKQHQVSKTQFEKQCSLKRSKSIRETIRHHKLTINGVKAEIKEIIDGYHTLESGQKLKFFSQNQSPIQQSRLRINTLMYQNTQRKLSPEKFPGGTRNNFFDSSDPYQSSATMLHSRVLGTNTDSSFNTIMANYQNLMSKIKVEQSQFIASRNRNKKHRIDEKVSEHFENIDLESGQSSYLSRYTPKMDQLSRMWTINHITKSGDNYEKQDHLIEEFQAMK